LTFKNDGAISNLKMKRIADKLTELTNKYPNDKKKGRLKTQKDEIC
jgi:membrane protein insertase Oxa1/YidC/SpoIIIJ